MLYLPFRLASCLLILSMYCAPRIVFYSVWQIRVYLEVRVLVNNARQLRSMTSCFVCMFSFAICVGHCSDRKQLRVYSYFFVSTKATLLCCSDIHSSPFVKRNSDMYVYVEFIPDMLTAHC